MAAMVKPPKTKAPSLVDLRKEIDHIDNEVFNLLGRRMELADSIGLYKKRNNIAILQTTRWNEILERAIAIAQAKGLSSDFITTVLRAIHQESINHQEAIMTSEGIKS
jgi:chorismate mutase